MTNWSKLLCFVWDNKARVCLPRKCFVNFRNRQTDGDKFPSRQEWMKETNCSPWMEHILAAVGNRNEFKKQFQTVTTMAMRVRQLCKHARNSNRPTRNKSPLFEGVDVHSHEKKICQNIWRSVCTNRRRWNNSPFHSLRYNNNATAITATTRRVK